MAAPLPQPALNDMPDIQRRASDSQLLGAESSQPKQASASPELAPIATGEHDEYGLAPAFDALRLGADGSATPIPPHDYTAYTPQHYPYVQQPHAHQQQQPAYGQYPDMYGAFLPPQHTGYAQHAYYDPAPPFSPDMHMGQQPYQQGPRATPVQGAAAHSHYPPFSRPGTAQTQATHGSWGSPPMSPAMAPMAPMAQQTPYGRHSRHGSMVDEFGAGPRGGGGGANGGGFYSSGPRAPPSAWSHSSMSSPFAFYTPFGGHSQRLDNLDSWPAQPSPAIGPAPGFTPPPAWGQVGSIGSVGANNRSRNRMSWSGPTRAAEPPAPVERKEYHPQAPVRRSDWVMWVGNVPGNVSHEELWKFFNTTIPVDRTDSSAGAPPWRGPSSIFLISRSSCAFVNFSSQTDLDRAVPFFNGMALRPLDPRCPRMVCRVRRKDDDLRAGVGAQRGVGMHRSWVKEQGVRPLEPVAIPAPDAAAAEPDVHSPGADSVHSPGAHSVPPSPAIFEHPPEGEGRRRESLVGIDHPPKEHKSTASFASTNSSFLTKYFPKRYFILKSLTTIDLEDSARAGTWKTQRHNEPILDQAFRTSQEVILIFGANRSGEFFGYAKMIEPVNKEKAAERAAAAAAKASAAKGPSLTSNGSSGSGSGSGSGPSKQWSTPERIREEESDTEDRTRAASDPARPALRPSRLLSSTTSMPTASPGQLTEEEERRLSELVVTPPHAGGERKTDPARPLGPARDDAPRAKTIDVAPPPVPISAALHGVAQTEAQQQAGQSDRPATLDGDGVRRKDTVLTPGERDDALPAAPAADDAGAEALLDPAGDSWGQPFRVQWLKVAPLPFQRTRQLRNPWNGDREVKVSRDGTEVEPGVGAQLLSEWDRVEQTASYRRPPLPTSPVSSRFGIPTDVAYAALY